MADSLRLTLAAKPYTLNPVCCVMYEFILQFVIFSSLGVMIYLLARGLARAGEVPAAVHHSSGWFDRLLTRLPLPRIDATLNAFFEKLLRRVRLVTLRIDNWINTTLAGMKRQNGEKAANGVKPDLFSGKANGSALDEKGGPEKE